MDRPSSHADAPIMYEAPGRLASRDRVLSWGLFGLALLVRAVYLAQLRRTPFWSDLSVDLGYYHDWGMRIAAGDPAGREVFEQSPLYAYFLALIFKLFGPGLLAPRLAQILIGSGTCVLVWKITRTAFSSGAGLTAGLLAVFYGPFLFHDGMIMKTSLAVFLTVLMIHLLSRGTGSQSGLLGMAGLCLGLGSLVRDNLILLAPVVSLWLMAEPWVGRLRMRKGRLMGGVASVATFGVGVLLVVAPVAARNYHVGGELVLLTAGGGEVFYIGNNANADGYYSPPPFVRASSVVEHEDFRVEAARRLGRPVASVSRKEASDYWLGQGLEWIAANPGDYIALLGRKLLVFWSGDEVPDTHDYGHYRRLVPILGLPVLTFGPLAALAAVGLGLSLAQWRGLLLLYMVGAGYVATVMLFFNFGRFRMPFVPVLMAFAGFGLVALAGAIRASRWAAFGWAIALGVAMFVITSLPLADNPVQEAKSSAQLAELLVRSGRIDEAESELGESLRIFWEVQAGPGGSGPGEFREGPPPLPVQRPELGRSFYDALAEAYQTRSAILRARGETAQSAAWALSAARMADHPIQLTRSGQRLVEAGRFDEAAATFRRALEALDHDADPAERLRLTLHLAEAVHRSGKPREALALVESELDRGADLSDPDEATAHYGEALIYRDLGETELMRFHLRECLRLNPSHPRADWIRQQVAGW